MRIHPLKTVLLTILGLGAAAGLTGQPATATKVKLDAGLVFARGDYGLSADTDVLIGLLNPTVETEAWRLQASLPYVRLDGPASVVGATGPVIASRSASGIGDVSLTAVRKLGPDEHGWISELGLKVKLPTADETKGLGTGETDYTVQLDVFRTGGKVTPFATFGYQFLGRSAAYPMEDGFFSTIGFAMQASPHAVVGLAGNWREPTITAGKAGVEAMAFVQRKLTEKSRVQLFLLRGFTTASPDLAVGFTVGRDF